MKKILCIYVLLLAFSLTAKAHIAGPMIESDSGIRGDKYSEIYLRMKRLEKSFPNMVYFFDVALTSKNVLVGAVLITKTKKFNKVSLITGAHHGDEYLGIVEKLPEAFVSSGHKEFESYFNNGGAVLVVPIVNPDGYDRRQRGNANFVDINRDYPELDIRVPGLTQPEIFGLVNFVDELIATSGAQLSITMDYHCCLGALLMPYSSDRRRSMPSPVLGDHVIVGQMMQTIFPKYPFGGVYETIGYHANGTSMDYWLDKHGAVALAFEGAWRKEQKNLSGHIDWWRLILGSLK